MTREEMYERLKKVINITFKGEADLGKVTEDTNLNEELSITSVMNIEILVRLENEFGIEVDDDLLSMDLTKNLSVLAGFVEEQMRLQNKE